MRQRWFTLLVLLTATPDCGDPLISPTLVLDTRILGARVQAADDPDQASLLPGQAARLRWFVTSPDGPPTLGWLTTLCAAKSIARGLPACEKPNFGRYSPTQVGAYEPAFDFVLPEPKALDGATQINANASFCKSGTPILEDGAQGPNAATCPDPGESPLLATMPFYVASESSKNRNPSLLDVEVLLDKMVWPRWAEPSTPIASCAELGASLPAVRSGSLTHEIVLNFPSDPRERVAVVSSHSADRETIELAHFVTGGDLERVFSSIDFGHEPIRATVRWDAPAKASTGGQLVRFFFVLRDGRGGVDWATHAVCVVP